MTDEVYQILAKKIGFATSEYMPRILEMMMTPEEGEVIVHLSSKPDEIAQKLNISEDEVNRRLDGLRQRAIIWPAEKVWPFMKVNLFGPTFEQLRAMYFITAEKYLGAEKFQEYIELLREFYKAEWCEFQGKFYGLNEVLAMRVLPARKAFERTPEIAPSKVLPKEDVIKVYQDSEMIGLINCPCKVMWRGHGCNAPKEVCIQLNQWAQYTFDRGGGRKISLEEAIAVSDAAEEAGLVHTIPKDASIVMCNCCSDCCIVIDPARKAGTLNKAIIKSHYRSVINEDECIGCEDCVDRCPFDAIEMKKDSSGELKAVADEEKCYGCGVCVIACPPEAVTMKLVQS